MTKDDGGDTPAFACCSAGIGRWFWVAWESEAAAVASSPALATGYEPSAAKAEAKVAERFGPESKRLASRYATRYRNGPSRPANRPARDTDDDALRPPSRLRRPVGAMRKPAGPPPLAFLYGIAGYDLPDSMEQVVITRHRIVRQNARKIHAELEPFDEEAWARRSDAAEEPTRPAKTRTLPVDRTVLRSEGRFRSERPPPGLTLYAREEDALRDVEKTLTARHPWCAALGIRFPCSVASVKDAYRRLARVAHPDVGGDPAAFRAIEQAYREALGYFEQTEDSAD